MRQHDQAQRRPVRISRGAVMAIGAVVWPLAGVATVLLGARPGSILAEYPIVSIIALGVMGVIFGLVTPSLVLWAYRSRAGRNVLVAATGAAFFSLFFTDVLPAFPLARFVYGSGTWGLVFVVGWGIARVVSGSSVKQGGGDQG